MLKTEELSREIITETKLLAVCAKPSDGNPDDVFARDRKGHMPKRHGISYALATLMCTIAGAMIAAVLADALPLVSGPFEKLSAWFAQGLAHMTGLQLPPTLLSTAIIASALALVWGVAFAFLHSDSKQEGHKEGKGDQTRR